MWTFGWFVKNTKENVFKWLFCTAELPWWRYRRRFSNYTGMRRNRPRAHENTFEPQQCVCASIFVYVCEYMTDSLCLCLLYIIIIIIIYIYNLNNCVSLLLFLLYKEGWNWEPGEEEGGYRHELQGTTKQLNAFLGQMCESSFTQRHDGRVWKTLSQQNNYPVQPVCVKARTKTVWLYNRIGSRKQEAQAVCREQR